MLNALMYASKHYHHQVHAYGHPLTTVTSEGGQNNLKEFTVIQSKG